MRLGRLATDLFTLKYQTKHFLSCEVSTKQDSEEKEEGRWAQIRQHKEAEGKR